MADEILNTEYTNAILNEFYRDNLNFWRAERERESTDFIPEQKAIEDIRTITRNPYSPNGALLDSETKKQWIMNKEKEVNITTLQDIVKEHSNELQNTVEQNIIPDEKQNSYISKDEMEKMLDEHYKKVESLLEIYTQQRQSGTPIQEALNDFKDKLYHLLQQFKESIQERINEVKKNLNNQVDNVKDKVNEIKEDIHDNVNDVKESAIKKINLAILDLNDHIKTISQNLDNFVENNSALEPLGKEKFTDFQKKNMLNDYKKLNMKLNELNYDAPDKFYYNNVQIDNPKEFVSKEIEELKGKLIDNKIATPEDLKTLEKQAQKESEPKIEISKSHYEKLLDDNNKLRNSNNNLKNKLNTIEQYFKHDKAAFKEFSKFLSNDNKMEKASEINLDKDEIKKEQKIKKQKQVGMSL